MTRLLYQMPLAQAGGRLIIEGHELTVNEQNVIELPAELSDHPHVARLVTEGRLVPVTEEMLGLHNNSQREGGSQNRNDRRRRPAE